MAADDADVVGDPAVGDYPRLPQTHEAALDQPVASGLVLGDQATDDRLVEDLADGGGLYLGDYLGEGSVEDFQLRAGAAGALSGAARKRSRLRPLLHPERVAGVAHVATLAARMVVDAHFFLAPLAVLAALATIR